MLQFLLADANFAYALALAIVFGLALMEGLGLLLGMSILSALDNLAPFDLELDLDAGSELSSGGMTSVLGWLCLDRLPLLVWLILMLTSFAVAGLTLNYLAMMLFGTFQTSSITTLLALMFTLFSSHYLGQTIARIFPKNESSATATADFQGRIAVITVGQASKGNAAEAMLKDDFEQKHYVMVEPESPDTILAQGTQVVLLHKANGRWQVAEFNPQLH